MSTGTPTLAGRILAALGRKPRTIREMYPDHPGLWVLDDPEFPRPMTAWTGAAANLWLPYLAERRSLLRQRDFLLHLRGEVPAMVTEALAEYRKIASKEEL